MGFMRVCCSDPPAMPPPADAPPPAPAPAPAPKKAAPPKPKPKPAPPAPAPKPRLTVPKPAPKKPAPPAPKPANVTPPKPKAAPKPKPKPADPIRALLSAWWTDGRTTKASLREHAERLALPPRGEVVEVIWNRRGSLHLLGLTKATAKVRDVVDSD